MAGFFNKIGQKMDELVDSTAEKLAEVKEKFDPVYELHIPAGEDVLLTGTQSEIWEQLRILALLKEVEDDNKD